MHSLVRFKLLRWSKAINSFVLTWGQVLSDATQGYQFSQLWHVITGVIIPVTASSPPSIFSDANCLHFSHVTGSSGWLPPHTSWDGGGGGGLPFGWEAAADKEGRVYYVKWVPSEIISVESVWHFWGRLFVCPLFVFCLGVINLCRVCS